MCGGSKEFVQKLVREAKRQKQPRKVADSSESKPTIPRSSPPSSGPTSGGPTRLGIGRRPSTRKRSGVSGRSRSRSKAFSTKR